MYLEIEENNRIKFYNWSKFVQSFCMCFIYLPLYFSSLVKSQNSIIWHSNLEYS